MWLEQSKGVETALPTTPGVASSNGSSPRCLLATFSVGRSHDLDHRIVPLEHCEPDALAERVG